MLTGVRIGESAARDQRIALSCTKDGGECGQGWFQQTSSQAVADRSEEHTSELQSLTNLVCRLLLEKKKNRKKK